MKKRNWEIVSSVIFFASALWLGTGCHKKIDEPPPYTGTDIQSNLTIRDLRSMHFTGNFEKVLDEFIIEGMVTADDSHDNFYKSIVIQDSTGGITIRLDGSGLYNVYPVGTQVFIKLKDLWMGDYAKMIQLGAGVDRSDPAFPELIGIPQPLFDRYIKKGMINHFVIPKTVRFDQLNDSLQSCLVKINDVEFAVADTGKTFGDAINKLSVNNIIKACSGGSVYLRTSGFAGFAAAKTPRGNGSITAVYSVFRTEKQLLIRDTSDVQMNGLRCTGNGAKILFSEDFERLTANSDLAGNGWKNIPETGGKYYQAKATNNNKYAEISAFATGEPLLVSWLILPMINLANSANEVLSFQTKDGFDNGAVLQVYASTNYDGGNTPWKAKWVLLKAIISKGNGSGLGNNWVPSANISLSSFTSNLHIAFRYEGADPGNVFDKHTTTFQLDDVKIVGN